MTMQRPPKAPSVSKLFARPPKPPTALEDPAPQHLKVETDDLHSFADFSALGVDIPYDDNELEEEKKAYEDTDEHVSKSCVPPLFWKKKKVSAFDVASVGNASDTVVTVNSHTTFSGRELHENAKVALNAGDYDKSLGMFEAILCAQVGRFGSCHPSVAAALHNVAVCRHRMGQHDLAENLFQEAVQVREQTLGSHHLEVAISLSKLGAARVALHKLNDAFDDLRRAARIARLNLGPNHKTVAQILSHLACLYFEKGELLAAQATFEDALEIYRTVWNQEEDRDACMMQLTDTLCNIGSIQNRRKRFGDAISTFAEALDLQRGILAHNHPRIISTLDNLGFAYSKNKEYSKALSCYKHMMRAQVSHSGTFTDDCFVTFRKQILVYEKLKKLSEAIDETKDTLKLEKSMLPRDSKIIADTKAILEDLRKKRDRRKDSNRDRAQSF